MSIHDANSGCEITKSNFIKYPKHWIVRVSLVGVLGKVPSTQLMKKSQQKSIRRVQVAALRTGSWQQRLKNSSDPGSRALVAAASVAHGKPNRGSC